MRFVFGTRTPSKRTSAWLAQPAPRSPMIERFCTIVKPGVPMATRI
jgi:hypothetical protein